MGLPWLSRLLLLPPPPPPPPPLPLWLRLSGFTMLNSCLCLAPCWAASAATLSRHCLCLAGRLQRPKKSCTAGISTEIQRAH